MAIIKISCNCGAVFEMDDNNKHDFIKSLYNQWHESHRYCRSKPAPKKAK